MQSEKYYKSSNKANPVGLLILLIVTIAAGSALSVLYLFLVRVIPVVQLSVLLTILFGGALGWIGSLICSVFKIRNRALAIIVSIVGILIYSYVKWCLFTSYTISNAVEPAEASYFSLLPGYLADPAALFADIKLINEYGTWSLGRSSTTAVTGIFLTAVWIAEFLIYAIIHLIVVNSKAATPFIEKDNKWAKKSDVRFYCRDFNVKAELSRIETDPSLLLSFLEDPQKISAAQYVVIDLYHSSDFTENYIDIIRVSITNAAQNKKSETTLVKKLAVNREIAQSLYAQHNMTLPI